MRRTLAALALLLLLASPAAGSRHADEEEEPSPYGTVDGVTYYMAAGLANGSALAHDAGAGEQLLVFQGCAYLQFRPGFDRGRLAVSGLLDDATPLVLEMSEFEPDGFVRTNSTLGPDDSFAVPEGASPFAELWAAGTAQMHAGILFPPDASPVNPPRLANFTDPVTGDEDLRAQVFAARDGVRDDATSARLDRDAGGDAEVHVTVASPDGAAPGEDRIRFGPPAALPDGSAAPDSEHLDVYELQNTRFGGTARLVLESTSRAPPGMNQVALSVYAPDGFEVANGSAASSVLGAGRAEMEFPLDQVGTYTLRASGSLLLGSYSVDVTLRAPPAFRMDFWWEDVVRGDAARSALSECQGQLGLRAQVVDGSVQRTPPPRFPLTLVVVAAVAATTTLLLVVKFASDTFASWAFRRQLR